jgi:uncharacterized membrane protein YkoI
MKFRTAIAALLLAATLPATALAQDGRPALGAGRGDQDQARAAVRSGRQIPLARIIQMIQARSPGGQLLNASNGEQGGRPAYFVQWRKKDGGVVVFIVDAESGAILGQQGG